jgi:hypothetical protein
MCLHVPSIPAERALGKAFEGDGLSQRAGLMGAMIIGAIEVRPARESEKGMSWPEVTVKAVSNSDEVVFCSVDARRWPPRARGPARRSIHLPQITSIRSISRSL